MTTLQKHIRNRVLIVLSTGYLIGLVWPFILMWGYEVYKPTTTNLLTGLLGPATAICFGGRLLGGIGASVLPVIIGYLGYLQIRTIVRNIRKSDKVTALFTAIWLAVEWNVLVMLGSYLNIFD